MPSALIFYQYFHPDDVVSSVHLTELAAGLVARGWDVTAMPCNRSCRDDGHSYPGLGESEGVQIRRLWRPALRQASTFGRLANAAWMIARWSTKAFTNKPDVVIIGTDPILSIVSDIVWKLVRPQTKIAHWCFDLYPEAAIADGILKPTFALAQLQALVGLAYRRVDLMADIGDCMRQQLAVYKSRAKAATLPPWALTEPATALRLDPEQRQVLFGSSKLGLLYSGTFGRAHSYAEILTIARLMRGADAHFSFAVRGNRTEELQKSVDAADTNISFAPFVSQDKLEARLSAADIHIVSLRQEWTGTVVPSKFFGAIAAGRPVLFIGSENSFIARTIRRYRLGWVCDTGKEAEVAEELTALARAPETLIGLRARCHRVYHEHFARERILDGFDRELRAVLPQTIMQPTKSLQDRLAS